MKRRTLLGSLAAGCAGALAGCGDRGGQPAPSTGTERTSAEPQDESVDPKETGWQNLQKRFGFEKRVNAVEDLGWDPNGKQPVNDSIEESFDRKVLIQVPPGTYKLAESVAEEDVASWGLTGLGKKRSGVKFTTNKRSRIEFKLLDSKDILLDNFTFEQGDKFDRTMGMTFFITDNLQISDVEIAGANPTSNPSAVNALALNVVDPDGSALVERFVRTGPQVFKEYPKNELCIFSGRAHRGTITYRDLHIENAGENGIYASKCPGKIHVEGGLYRNNRNDNVRISGKGSYVKNAKIVIDSENYHPRNRGVRGNMRGIRMQSGDKGFTGGLIEDTRLELLSSDITQALVMIAHNQGAMTMRNCELRNRTKYHSFRVEPPSSHVAKPLGVNLENVRMVEHGQGGAAVTIEKRPNSAIRNVSIETGRNSGQRNGIVLSDSKGTVFENVKVSTNGIPLWINRPSTPLQDYSLEFKGQNEFTIENNLFVDSSFSLSLSQNRTVFPFRDAGDDVDALLVTGLSNDSMQFEYVSS